MESKLKVIVSGVVMLAVVGFLIFFFWHTPPQANGTSLSKCPVPPAFHTSDDRVLEIGGVSAGGLNVANLKVQDISKFYRVLNDQATTALVVDYLICRSEERNELDPKDADAVNYYRRRTDYVVQTHPTAEQLADWEKQNPPPQKVGKLITPDFVPDNGGKWVIVLTDPNSRREAKIENFGNAELTYVLGNVPEPQLWVLPRGQQHVAANGESVLTILLGFGANQPEYTFSLQSNVESGARVIVVQIPKLADAIKQQQKLTEELSHNLLAALSTPTPNGDVPDSNAARRLVETAARTVQDNYPQLDESSRWITTSQVLLASHWPSLAVAALDRAEQSDASVSQRPALQRYAAHVAYLANTDSVFTQHPVKVADVLTPADAAQLAAKALDTNVLFNGSNQGEVEKLIQQMSRFNDLNAIRLSLQGDLYLAQQNPQAATSSYGELTKLVTSRSAALRLSSLQARTGKPQEAQRTLDKVATLNNNATDKQTRKYVLQDAKERPIG